MPTITVNKEDLFKALGKRYSKSTTHADGAYGRTGCIILSAYGHILPDI